MEFLAFSIVFKGEFRMRSRVIYSVLYLGLLLPSDVFASSFEGSLQSLVTAVVGKIMPICAMPYVAKTAFGYVKGDPIAVQQSPTVAVGVVALLGINGLWAFLQSHVR
jgi:hypothetical protein